MMATIDGPPNLAFAIGDLAPGESRRVIFTADAFTFLASEKEYPMRYDTDDANLRLQCLKLALDALDDTRDVVPFARELYAFVSGSESATADPTQQAD